MLVELNYPTPIPVELDPAQTLLLIVDMENESAHPKAPLYMGEPVERIIPRIAALRKYVRESGGKVVHTQSVRKPEALEFTLFKNVIRKIEGSWGAEFIDALKPQPDEPVVVKYTHDCFYQTNLEALLKQLGMKPDSAFATTMCTYPSTARPNGTRKRCSRHFRSSPVSRTATT
jgi:nicotinamidase-related amidase